MPIRLGDSYGNEHPAALCKEFFPFKAGDVPMIS